MNEFVLADADNPNRWVASYETLEQALDDMRQNQLTKGTLILWDRIPNDYQAIYLIWQSKIWERKA